MERHCSNALRIAPPRHRHAPAPPRQAELAVVVVNFCQWRNTARLVLQRKREIDDGIAKISCCFPCAPGTQRVGGKKSEIHPFELLGPNALDEAHLVPESFQRAYRDAIRVNIANPLLAAVDVVLLDRLAKTLDRVEGDWDRLDETCTRTPATLVHGDIQRKNMYVRAGDDGKEPALYVIDWETAGWGVPAVDLPKIDLPAYCDTVRSAWPGVRLEDVRRLAAVGVVFLQLAAIHWVSPELAYDRADHLVRPMSWLRVLHERLEQGLADLRGLS